MKLVVFCDNLLSACEQNWYEQTCRAAYLHLWDQFLLNRTFSLIQSGEGVFASIATEISKRQKFKKSNGSDLRSVAKIAHRVKLKKNSVKNLIQSSSYLVQALSRKHGSFK